MAALAIRAWGRGRSITYPSWLALVQTGKFNLRQRPCCHFRSDCIWHATLYPVYTIQPVVQPIVNPVEQPVEQPAASCKQTFNRLSNRLFNRFDNRLYRVNGVLESHEHYKPACSSKNVLKLILRMTSDLPLAVTVSTSIPSLSAWSRHAIMFDICPTHSSHSTIFNRTAVCCENIYLLHCWAS